MLNNPLFLPFFLIKKVFTLEVILCFIFIYAGACFYLVNHVLKKTNRYRVNRDIELHKKYEMFQRLDMHHWNPLKLYIGCFFCLWIKLTGVLFSLFFCYLGLRLFIKKTDDKNNPDVKRKINFFIRNGTKMLIFFLGVLISVKKSPINYKKYLGEVENENNIIPSIQISNHTSWLDILIFMNLTETGFLAKSDVKKYPLIGMIAECLGSVFVDRDDKNSLGNSLELVIQKQKEIFEGRDISKFMIFPEGTTSNNTGILDFKRGAFMAELPIKPYVIKFDPINKISLAMDVIEMLYHIFIVIAVPVHFVEIIELPVFKPNQNIFKNPNKERWFQYAEVMKEIMCEASGLKKQSGGYTEKQEYLKFLRDGTKDKLN